MIRNKQNSPNYCKSDRAKHPIWQLSPVSILYTVKIAWFDQLPRSENIDFMSPNDADIVKGQGKIDKQEYFFSVGHAGIAVFFIQCWDMQKSNDDRRREQRKAGQ